MLTSVGGDLRVWDNDWLEGLDGLSAITTIGLDLSIVSNTALTTFAPLGNVTSVGHNVDIEYNPLLSDLGLEALTSVGWDLLIYENDDLPQCEACDLLDQLVGFTGTIAFYSNQADTCSDDCT